jgi:hypothetical protein
LNYIKIEHISFLSDISAALIKLPVGAESKKNKREVGEMDFGTGMINKLFKQYPYIASGFSRLSCWIHRSENTNAFSAVYWIVQQERSCSHTMEFILHPHRIVSLLSPAPPATFSVLITHWR